MNNEKIINNEDGNLDDFAYYGKTFEKEGVILSV